MVDNRNMILAIVLSVVILLGFNYWTAQNAPPPEVAQQTTEQAPGQGTGQGTPSLPSAPGEGVAAPGGGAVSAPGGGVPSAGAEKVKQGPSRDEVIARTKRLQINSPRLIGSISLTGARIDDLTLATYRETLDPESDQIVFLQPRGLPQSYFAEFGWVPDGEAAVPNGETVWSADSTVLEPGVPVNLTWDNGQGLTFVRTYTLDEDFMFTVNQRVENNSAKPVTLYPFGLVSRWQTPETTRFFILHEGLLGVFDETLEEIDYDDLQESGKVEKESTGGWIGITDKYWLAALVPDQKSQLKSRFTHHREGDSDRYQVDYLGAALTIAPGEQASTENHLFAGAKEVNVLDAYEEKLGITRFDLAIDFGWFYFLTKPIFYLLIYINDYVGNFGVAILLLTVVIKILFFPLANKSYRAMSKMKLLQPEMTKLRERFGDDRQRMNQEMMALYKREKANPASGCLPMFIQIPVFFSLYKVLFVTIEMRQAPFFGWIHDLSVPDPTSIFNLFGLIPWDPLTIIPASISIGVWPLIMGISMFLQQKLNPQPADPVQAKVFMFLPLIFTFLLAQFPAGLVIYWAWNNTLSIGQQWVIMKKAGVR
ncbi:MAG: membrane protein insertase YidC [Rhodospirillales bacterium]|jgi:YidC/Oxa1 family membrane protein insertase|nr:membrane protein insertase YidC [Rhodospirillales bacterium]